MIKEETISSQLSLLSLLPSLLEVKDETGDHAACGDSRYFVFFSVTFFVRRGLHDSMLKFLFLVLGLNFLEATR